MPTPMRRAARSSELGVVFYLTHDASACTIKFVGYLPAGSGITLDYAVEPSSLRFMRQMVFAAIRRHVGAAGEPFRLFFSPKKIAAKANWRIKLN